MVQLASSLIPKADVLPGSMTRDPRLLPVWDATNAGPYIAADSGGSFAPININFWNPIAKIGAYASGAIANTYKQIADITGSGYLFHVVSPANVSVNDDVYFRITVDGTVYEIAKTQILNNGGGENCRVVLGTCSDFQSGNFYTATNANFQNFANHSPSAGNIFRAAGNVALTQPWLIRRDGLPCVRFDKSLKVETKVTNVVSGGFGGYCGATYLLD